MLQELVIKHSPIVQQSHIENVFSCLMYEWHREQSWLVRTAVEEAYTC